MPPETSKPLRSDARRNRDRLLDVARDLFARRGVDVPLEDVAQAAGVSRATLYRHFATRESLAASVYEHNVLLIEERADELAGRGDGVLLLVDHVLAIQESNRGFAGVLATADITWFTALSERTEAAFDALLGAARAAGRVHPDVETTDIMLAFSMAAGAFADDEASAQPYRSSERVHAMIRRALFVEP